MVSAWVFFLDELLEMPSCEVMFLEGLPDEGIAASLRIEHFLSRDLVVRIHDSRDRIAMASAWVFFLDELLELLSCEAMLLEGLPDEGIAAYIRVELVRLHCSTSPVYLEKGRERKR